jgi:hypothetical protein
VAGRTMVRRPASLLESSCWRQVKIHPGSVVVDARVQAKEGLVSEVPLEVLGRVVLAMQEEVLYFQRRKWLRFSVEGKTEGWQ